MKTDLNTKGFIYDGKYPLIDSLYASCIEELTYGEYLSEYGSDECTSPRGVAPRLHIRENGGFHVWTWGINGNNPRFVSAFDSEEEANEYLYESWESNLEQDWNAPAFFESMEELIRYLSDRFEKEIPVIERWLNYREFARHREINRKAALAEERKQKTAVATNSIVIDDEFKSEVEVIKFILIDLPESERNDYKTRSYAKAFTALLKRNNISDVGDFWKAFRIVKSKLS